MLKADPVIHKFLVDVAIAVRSRFPRVPSATLIPVALDVAGSAAKVRTPPRTREAFIGAVAAVVCSRLVAGGAA